VTALLALGGGGFTSKPGDPPLDDLVLDVSTKGEPRLLFLPTAGGDAAAQITNFYSTFGSRPCRAEHLSLFRLEDSMRSLRDIVLDQDIIYVGGGSMRNLLAIWGAHGLDSLLIEAYRSGVVLAGLSAGAMCWFSGAITRSSGQPEPIKGLGLLEHSLSVHADGDPLRLPVFLEAVQTGKIPGGWAVDDGAGLLFRDGKLERIVSARPGAGAVRADAVGGELVRNRVAGELLESKPRVSAKVDDVIRELRAVRELRASHQRRD
jgi:dipeptidase E